MKNNVDLFLDSGAFSAWTQKTEINIQEYIEFIFRNKKYISVYANLDSIGDPEQTWKNQKTMEAAGLTPLPCFHLNEDYEWLQRYCEKYEYIAIGGMVGSVSNALQPFLDTCFGDYICDAKGIPKVKVHGFGLTSLKLMMRYPWYSVDSTSWVMTSRMGGIMVPRFRSGEYVYDEQSWKISVSNQSPDTKEAGEHISTLSPRQREVILDYIHMKGYKLGKSSFRQEKGIYTLKEGEKWAGGRKGDVMRNVETIEEPGLCNDYKLRDEMNIIYYMDLEKALPEWPWPFKIGINNKGLNLL